MNNKITPTDLFLAILAIMLLSISFYQTWLGLEQIFGGSAVIVSLVISFIMLFLLWQIRKARSIGNSTGSLTSIYFFFATFCFVANFNALYVRFMRTDIYTTELRNIKDKLNNLQINVETSLNYSVPDAKTRQDITNEVKLLKIQITDPQNKGIGTEARQIIHRIERLIGKKITPLTPINSSRSGYEDLADRMAEQINQMVYTLAPEENLIKKDINNVVESCNTKILKLLQLPEKKN